MEIAIALLVLGALVVANGFATRVVLRDPDSERRQRLFQLLVVWLVPVLGAIFVFALHRTPEKPSGRYRESPDPTSDDFAHSRYVGRAINPHVDD